MKRSVKIALIAGLFCMLVGLVIVGVTAVNGLFDSEPDGKGGISVKQISNTKYTDKTFTVKDSFDAISVEVASEDVKLFTTDGDNRIEVHVQEDKRVSVEVKGDRLIVKCDNENFKMFNFDYEETYVHLYLNKTDFDDRIIVDTASGDVRIPKDFSFGEMIVNTASGDSYIEADVSGNVVVNAASGKVTLLGLKASSVSINTASGDIKAESLDVKEQLYMSSASGNHTVTSSKAGSLVSDTSSGDTNVTGTNIDMLFKRNAASGETKIKDTVSDSFEGDVTSGDIEFEKYDAHKIYIETTSADVEGSFKSGKQFSTDTTSGDIKVPADEGSDTCRIETVSGDVNIKIA